MPTKIATAEDVQAELRTLLAMTEEENPSRAKMADAIGELANRVAGERVAMFGDSLWDGIQKALEEFSDTFAIKLATELDGWRIDDVNGMAANQLKTVMEFKPVETARTKGLVDYMRPTKLNVYATLMTGMKIKLFAACQMGSGEYLRVTSEYDSFSGIAGIASGFARDLRAHDKNIG